MEPIFSGWNVTAALRTLPQGCLSNLPRCRRKKAVGKFLSAWYVQRASKWKESRTKFPGNSIKYFDTVILIDVPAFHTLLLLLPLVCLLAPRSRSRPCHLVDSQLNQSLCTTPNGPELTGNHRGLASSAPFPRPSMPAHVHFLNGGKSWTDI